MLASVDKAGRIVIPKDIRDRLDLAPGVELDMEIEGDGIRIERRRKPGRRLHWVEGRPVFLEGDGPVLTDADVQRLREADQR